MRKRAALVLAGSLMAASTASAHHSFSMFDSSRLVTWEGTVEAYQWGNPHGHIIINVPKTAKDPATAGRWDIEGQSANIMMRQGWTKGTLKPGDKVTIVGYPLRDGSKAGSLYYAIVDGKELYGDPNRRGGPAGGRND